MDGIVLTIATVISLVACVALWNSMKLAGEVKRLKRNEYYTEQKLKGVAKEIADVVDPIRFQLAGVVAGHSVSEDLIRRGRLYWDVSAEEAGQMISKDGIEDPNRVMIVDVRTVKEHSNKHVPGAKLIPIEELESRYKNEIPSSVGKIFVYCAGGDRSRLACDFLSRQGYLNLYNIHDGLNRWQGPTTGNPTVNLIQIQPKSKLGNSSPR